MICLRTPCSLIAILLTIAVADARAEPDSDYPTNIIRRPMTLPAGIVQGNVTASLTTYEGPGSFLSTDLETDVGTAVGELSAHVGVLLVTPDELSFANDVLSVVGVSARVLAASNIAVDLGADLLNPRGDFRRSVVGGHVSARTIIAGNVLVEYGGGLDYSRPFAGNDFQRYSVNANLAGVARGQISPGFATVIDTRIAMPLATGYDDGGQFDPLIEVGARGIATTRHTDLFIGAALTTRGESSGVSVLAGITARLP